MMLYSRSESGIRREIAHAGGGIMQSAHYSYYGGRGVLRASVRTDDTLTSPRLSA